MMLFNDFADNGTMWTGNGPREVRRQVRFREPFQTIPAVTVGISLWDTDHNTNTRVDIATDAVTPEGFDILFRTWGDSRLARIRADWMAIGQARDEDDWDVT